MHRTIAFVLVATALIFSAYNWVCVDVAADEALQFPGKTEFEGKIVTVYPNGSGEGSGQVMTDVEIVEVGKRLILVGTGADTGQEGDWTQDVRVGIPWENVRSYFAMTPEQFEKMAEIYDAVH